MTPETRATILDTIRRRQILLARELTATQRERIRQGKDPNEGEFVLAATADLAAIDAALSELEAEPKPGAIVVSKTQLRMDGSERTVHYLCGDQRTTREAAVSDLASWLALPNLAAYSTAVNEALAATGFRPGRAGLSSLIAERRALWDALAKLVYLLNEQDEILHLLARPAFVALESAVDTLKSSWLADPANREGGAG